jgi:multidrug efflux pump subunit AcrA (membrane-fusion protein)
MSMKKTNAVTKIVGFLFFIALLAYLGVYIIQALEKPFSTALAVSYTDRNSSDITGIVVRDEEVISSVSNTVYITAQEGKRVSKNGELAQAFDSNEDLHRAVRINELEEEISQLQALRINEKDATDLLSHDASIYKNILELKSDLVAGSFSNIEAKTIQLRTLIMTGAKSAADIKAQLDELEAQLKSLQNSATGRSVSIYAPVSGLFSTAVDGWEDLNTDNMMSITASELAGLLNEDRAQPDNVIGKLAYGTKWQFAALVDKDVCVSLEVGGSANLLFGKYYNEKRKMKIESISHIENGMCAVVFSCETAIKDVLNIRKQEAELVFSELTGLRVPKKSIHIDEDGNTCVYVQTALQAERKPVKIVKEYKDFYLVSSSELHAGDQIIVSGKNLYNGKVVE